MIEYDSGIFISKYRERTFQLQFEGHEEDQSWQRQVSGRNFVELVRDITFQAGFFHHRGSAIVLRVPDGQWVDLFDHELFANLPTGTKLRMLASEAIVDVSANGYSLGSRNGVGYYTLHQIYQDSRVFNLPHRRLNKF